MAHEHPHAQPIFRKGEPELAWLVCAVIQFLDTYGP